MKIILSWMIDVRCYVVYQQEINTNIGFLHETLEAHRTPALHASRKMIFRERERERWYKTSWLHECWSSWEAGQERGAVGGGVKWWGMWFGGGAANKELLALLVNQLLLAVATICCTGELCKIPWFIAFHKTNSKYFTSYSSRANL